jgi:hypothetical protein
MILYHFVGRDRGYDIISSKKGYVQCLVFVSVGLALRPKAKKKFIHILLGSTIPCWPTKKIEIQIRFFYTFGILTAKMTTKMYTKLASIEINDEILSKRDLNS